MSTVDYKKARFNVDHQLKACLTYAEQLYSQFKSFTSENNQLMREMVATLMALTQRELALNCGQEVEASLFAEYAAILASCVSSRLGCTIVMTPSEYPPKIEYYVVEYKHPERDAFPMRFALPSSISIAAYAAVWETRMDVKVQSMRVITEEEYTNMGEVRKEKLAATPKTEVKLTPPKHLLARSLRFSPEEVVIIERFKEAGALEAFSDVQTQILQRREQALPKDMEACFLGYLRSITPYTKRVPQNIRAQFQQEHGGEVSFFQANEIVMVLSNGEVRQFLPIWSIIGSGNRPQSINIDGIHVEQKTPLIRWKKTGMGYVPADKRLFLESLMHTTGDYGRKMRNVPIRNSGIQPQPKTLPFSQQTPPNPPLDLTKVRFTRHALEQFAERFPERAKNDPEKSALALLARATEDKAISKVGYVHRAISNKFVDARYFKADRCRFVIKEQEDGVFDVLTIEYAYLN